MVTDKRKMTDEIVQVNCSDYGTSLQLPYK